MICEWAMLCHDIEPHAQSGGMSIIGVFVTLAVDRLPPSFDPVCVAARFSGIDGETGACSLIVHDPDGQVLRTIPEEHIRLTVGYVDVLFNIGPLPLKRTGMHNIRIAIDGNEIRRVPMLIERGRLM